MISNRLNEHELFLNPPYPSTGRYRISSPRRDDCLSLEGEIADLLHRAETSHLRRLIVNQIADMLRTFKVDHEHTAYYNPSERDGYG